MNPQRTRAVAKVEVQRSHDTPYDLNDPALVEVRISETFRGDLDGVSEVRALKVQLGPRTARLVSLQRVHGRLGGRDGAFVLQGQETVDSGRITAVWSVVPGSGTGDLTGLRGEGGFGGEFGQGSTATLDYWFE